MRRVGCGICGLGLALLATVAANCGGHSTTEPTPPVPPNPTQSSCATGLKMYSSSSASGPWTSQTITVAGAPSGTVCLTDPSPIRMPDGTILLYYTLSGISGNISDQHQFAAAQSTDNGRTFTQKAIVFTSPTDPVADAFPLMLDASGTIRLFYGPNGVGGQGGVRSVTATSGTGLAFPSTPDPGVRVTTSVAVPGALKIGATYYLYVGTSDYYISSDGLNFSPGGSTVGRGGSASPIDAGGGTYLMAYACPGIGDTAPTKVACLASSADGINWTQTSQVGLGTVPGLVKDSSGTLHIYVVSFPGQ